MQYLARNAAARRAALAVWSELGGERQAQVVALLVRLALQWAAARGAPTASAPRSEEEGSHGDPEDDGQTPQ
jgi:hypothetical protein